MVETEAFKKFIINLQHEIITSLAALDGNKFHLDRWKKPIGEGVTSILENGKIIERGGINFSHVKGKNLPPSAAQNRREITGGEFEALGLSCVIHPQNPHVPTIHMNIRLFIATDKNKIQHWWFGGGIDMTPYYGYEDDVIDFHTKVKQNLDKIDKAYYPKFKDWCDSYFFIPHRNEYRGVGGVFFDDLCSPNFDTCFSVSKGVGQSFLPSYLPIVRRRKDVKFNDRERDFQLYRRGRYVEFNLVHDRGTLFGLQSNGRIESILMSMPPLVSWKYNWEPAPKSREYELTNKFLTARDWIKN